MSAIAIEAITKQFGGYQALSEVNLTVADQEFLVLLGPSGCGKTTLLRIIAGLETASSGRIRIGERDVTDLPPRHRRLAMVFQNYAVFPHLTVEGNIAFGLKMQKADPARIRAQVGKAAEMMHISHLLDRYSSQLSGGQRQRVAVARALAVEPEVLLMDEPLSNLDALLRLEMRAELKGLLQQSRTTTIYVTHDQVEAMSLADRIVVMRSGELIQAASPIDVYQNPADSFVGGFIGNPPMNFIRTPAADGRARIGTLEFALPAGAGAEVLLGIRPEDLEPANPEAGMEAIVQVAEPLGPHVLLTLKLAGQMVRYTAPADSPARPGDVIYLKPNASRLRWMDAASGRAFVRL